MASQGKEKGGKSFKSALQALESATKDVLHFTKAIAATEDLQSQNKDLQRQLDNAGEEIKKLQEKLEFEERKNRDQFQKFKEFTCEWTEEKNKLEAKVRNETQHDNREAQRKIKQLEERLKKADEATRRSQMQEQQHKVDIARLQLDLDKSELGLKSLKADIGVEEVNPERIIGDFQELEDRLEALTSKFFEQPSASPDSSELGGRLQPLRKNSFSTPSQSLTTLPYSNILCPRAPLAQSIIANKLSRDIFTPTCLPSPVGRMGMGEALERCSKLRPNQKAVLRSLSVMAFQADEERLRIDTLEIAVSDLMQELEPLLQSQEADNLRSELREFFLGATEVWKSLQRSPDWVLATSHLTSYPNSWRYSDAHITSEFSSAGSTPRLVLFPHIFCENGKQPLHCGLIWTGISQSKGSIESDGGGMSPVLLRKEYARSEPGRRNGSSTITTVSAHIKEAGENIDPYKHNLERVDKRLVGGNGDGHGGTRTKRHANVR